MCVTDVCDRTFSNRSWVPLVKKHGRRGWVMGKWHHKREHIPTHKSSMYECVTYCTLSVWTTVLPSMGLLSCKLCSVINTAAYYNSFPSSYENHLYNSLHIFRLIPFVTTGCTTVYCIWGINHKMCAQVIVM
jgi:hypothetical protein